jgi:hypothetical protein
MSEVSNCLTTDELHDLREALAAMYALPASDPNSFATIASFHGGPPTAYCAHGAPGFFTWHRAYLMAFENALKVVGCHVDLPFWDWASGPTTGVPEACRSATYVNRAGATVANPLYSGPRAAGGRRILEQRVNSVRVVLKSHHMQPEPVEIRAFIGQPNADAKAKTVGNITKALESLEAKSPEVSLKLVAVDGSGNEVPAEKTHS